MQAIRAYKIHAASSGSGNADFNTWSFTGGTVFNYYVNAGTLFVN